jgi:gamma-glutamylcyclotransferase (GGCT)/AIG2-like uncharacterized protein YtfP
VKLSFLFNSENPVIHRYLYIDCIHMSLFQGIMLVYDITNEKSFENIKNWIRNIEEVKKVLITHVPLYNTLNYSSKDASPNLVHGEVYSIQLG